MFSILTRLFNSTHRDAAGEEGLRAASSQNTPSLDTYPEYVPTTGPNAGKYQSKPAAFWTCGFFPASLYCLLERSMRFPRQLAPPSVTPEAFQAQLLALCRSWSEPLHANATRTNSHDLGFIMRALRMDWELTGEPRSLRSYITAAESLATRYDERVGAIRSWDQALSHSYEIRNPEENFLVIIDSMCNMDLLFYAAHHARDHRLSAIATEHAKTVIRTLVRPDNSTWHVVNLDQKSKTKGSIKFRMTHQGYSDDSSWARGQAWAILGFAQTFSWTEDEEFLDATQRVSDYFIAALDSSPATTHRYVPLWDFADADGDQDSEGQPLRDASAGMIAANGLLLLHQALQVHRKDAGYGTRYLDAALRIARDTIGYCLDRSDVARFEKRPGTKEELQVPPGSWDAILRHATANNNRNALMRYGDHGLVYADYYFLEFGNMLLRMNLI
ncbi:hypothetical protein VTK73DRAFT_3790 [Phialemonium thermophilum]|uniref:Uncharacterized protein n=1 Tax=Phialemonium thermophilum TaxID=223376 RepID=A0ABR3WXJ3_9PEZI